MKRSFLPRWTVAVVLAISATPGCQQWDPRGPGFDDSFRELGGYERPRDKSTQAFGFSTKAREIERDLGVE